MLRPARGLRGLIVAVSLFAFGGGPPRRSAASPPTPEGVDFFEKNIRPLLVERCYACHSAGAKKVGGRLLLDSKEGWQKGGDLGPAIAAGDPESSLLIQAVRYKDESLRMPPDARLSDREIALLTRWIERGVPDPRSGVAGASRAPEIAPERGKEFWAFRAPVDPAVPGVKDAAGGRSPLDRFILSGLETRGLAPAPEADRRTLIRRATFDLTGLPPTTEEIAAFLDDSSANAFAKVVDRLLASPRYGERWGRHWLDVARYADSNGLDENIAHGNAWRYRDYVIRSMNADKPYDQFLLEQLAGDLLTSAASVAETRERWVATGFLSLGPKVLAEVDEMKMRMDIVDEQIDAVGRAFMGLTLGCARCHDHKFDPITAADYYSLSGIFQSTQTMESFKKVARWHEYPVASKDEQAKHAAHEKEIQRQKAAIESLVSGANDRLKAAGGPGFTLPQKPEDSYPEATKLELRRLRDALAEAEKAAPELSSIMGVKEGKIVTARVLIRGNPLTPGEQVARRFPLVLASSKSPAIGEHQSGRLELARWLVDGNHPLTARVMVNRIWRWHFGQGLVSTPDNFGTIGDRPVHPELLDWLARRFVDGGWSIKALHRVIMLSSTYRMGGAFDPTAARVDPENRLRWRWEPRRLEAEAIRDSLLVVGGILDPTPGGPVLHVKNREYLFDHTSIDHTRYDSRRRSVYLPVIRNHVYDVFEIFDFPDPTVVNGHRASTTVALQSLFMMNSDLVHEATERTADRLLAAGTTDDAGRVRLLFESAFARPPTDAETVDALAFIDQYSLAASGREERPERRRLLAWQAYCQVVVSSNEFLYIR